MEDNKILKNALKWAGIAALFAIPFVLILRRWKVQEEGVVVDEDSNIFLDELGE